MKCIIHVDGGSRGNPGPAAAGVLILDADSGATLHEAGYFLGTITNNVAEYTGLIRSLQVADRLDAEAAHIHSDSELMVRQLTGQYKVRSADLQPLYQQARQLLDKLGDWKLDHVRREKNQEADALANLSMDARADVIVVDHGRRVAARPTSTRDTTGDGDEVAAQALPCWTVTLRGKSGQCIAGAGAGGEYTFGPTTPEGCCIHAAAAALNAGPMTWPRNRRTGATRCRACGQSLTLTRLA